MSIAGSAAGGKHGQGVPGQVGHGGAGPGRRRLRLLRQAEGRHGARYQDDEGETDEGEGGEGYGEEGGIKTERKRGIDR